MKTLAILLISALSFLAQAKPTIVGNVKGYTLSNSGALIQFSHIAFEGGKVLAIGDPTLLNQFQDNIFIDGKQKTLIPGLIDSHGHMLGLGATLLQVDVREDASAQKAAMHVRDYAAKNPQLNWVIGSGWNQVLWPDKAFPTAKQLDEYISDTPVWLERVDGHAGWANSKALELAGVDRNSVDPPGGKIVKDQQGNPTGVLIDTAMSLVEKYLPKADTVFYQASLDAATAHLLSLGITSMHDAGISQSVYDFYQNQAAQNQLKVRIYAMLAATDPNIESMLKAGYINAQNDFLSIRSVKVYGDGALGSRGAALFEDYSDAPHNRGLLVTQENQLKPLFDLVLGSKFQLNYHAIGDRANRLALDNFEQTFKSLGGEDLRNRVEHTQVISLDDIPRFKLLNIIPAMQPTHATSDMNMAEDRIGKDRLRGAYAWQRFVAQGSPLALGSDFPVELANPFYGLHAAVTRQDRNNQPDDGWIPSQSLTLLQAFKGFTIDGAYAAHQEQKLGGLTEGKWADFILIDRDIFSIPPEDIWKTQVLETWVAGSQVFSAQ
ncbi:amidohydrolase [Aliiglaciecola sp. LCG003]|uniref:amidohydrolase n=1 Tax=Aliiglaciecola sp. LCG003 TaxID=3053655 RepID=UPI0025729460|nr:amidohydrolase [Aliiglaciecola sp. LCG003]WJG08980.1 amidohydrolase [Aliiglaciecola sp. LCG003]